jgi:hypothetical protein
MSGSTGHGRSPRSAVGVAGLLQALALAGLLALPATVQAQAPIQAPVQAPRSAAKAMPRPSAAKSFVREDLASDGVRLEATLKGEAGTAKPDAKAAAKARAEGEALVEAEKPADALKPLGLAVAGEPGEPANWLAYARAASTVGNDDQTGDFASRLRLRRNARAAAYQGYLRAATAAAEAGALAVLGEVYADEAEWRPSLEAYRASLALADDAEVRETYEALRAEHGFRILNYTVDSDAAPRPTSRPTSRSRARPTPPSPPPASRSASTASSTASATPSWSAPACPPALGRPCSKQPITRSMSGTARPRSASRGATTSCPAPARPACPWSR